MTDYNDDLHDLVPSPGRSRRNFLTTSALGIAAVRFAASAAAPALDAAAARHIVELVARMTIAEKAGQLSCYSDVVRPLGTAINPGERALSREAMLRDIGAGGAGMLFNGHGVAGAIAAQRAALASRLAIPLLFAADIIHGYETIFPIPLGEAAAFDPDLSERIARAIAIEASAGGLHWTFAPMVDVARDQRWGRVAEGAGEDVHLGCLLAAARVRGFQGEDLRRDDSLCATPKHFAGYGAVTGGMEYGAVDLSAAAMRGIHLPPFAAAFAAGAGATIASFTDVDGVPATANRPLLQGLLRDALGFAGPCVSDYDAIRELIAHGMAADGADAARLAILAGIDIDMQSGLYRRHLPELVAAGRVPIAQIDRAVGRVLALKARLGLFERPFRSLDPATERRAIATPAIRALAREAAGRAIVLLKNDGALLPLARSVRRIALIGPLGAGTANLNGPWSFAGDRQPGIDLAQGVAAALVDPAALRIEPGCAIAAPLAGGIERAIAAAEASDIVLLAIGEGADMSGEANSRVTIALPAPQRALAEAVAATGKPLVVVLSHGRALALDGAVAAAPAILASWFLGCAAGDAIADILFGRIAPSGRLPVSFPFATGQQPWSYDRLPTGRPSPPPPAAQGGTGRWRDAPDAALYPFGHGLSYTDFHHDEPAFPARLAGPIAVSVRVRNVGARAGAEIVQLYARQRVAPFARPIRQLKAFARVVLDPGAETRVALTLRPEDFLLFDQAGAPRLIPGTIDLWIARDAQDPGLHGVIMLAPA